MKSLINIIKENGSGKEEAIEEVSSNIEEACCEDELYELPLETLTDILRHTREVEYKTAHTILTKATAKYGKRSVNVLSSLHVDEGLSELELETLLSLIPGIQIFSLLGSFTKKVEVDYEETIENERNLRKNLEAEVEMKNKGFEFLANEVNELKLQKELAKLKEIEDSSTKIEQKLETFKEINKKNRKGFYLRHELQQEIEVKPKEFEESIAKAKNCVSELQKIVNESNKTIKTFEKSQKAFPKLQKKFNEIDSNYQKLEFEGKIPSAILIGCICGKTTLNYALCNNKFLPDPFPAGRIEMYRMFSQHYRDVIDLYDTPGQICFKPLIINWLKKSEIVLLCFSKNNRRDFEELNREWVETNLFDNKKVILVKTMIDLEENEAVPREKAVELATEKGYKYFEVSAKTGEGINELREYIFKTTSEV